MKLLMLSYDFPPLGAGVSRVVAGLSRELVRYGHEVDVVAMGFRGVPRFERVDGVAVHRVPCLRRRAHMCTMVEAASYVASATWAMRRLTSRRRYDLIHAHGIFPPGVIAWLASRALGVPYVITAHGSDVPGYNPYRFQVAHRLLAPLWQQIVRHASGLVCPSRRLEGLARQAGSTTPAAIIPNGFDVPLRSPLTPPSSAPHPHRWPHGGVEGRAACLGRARWLLPRP